jgi:hypothetical protein
MSEVFDAAETPALSPAAHAAVSPEAWPSVRLVPIAALRLVTLRAGTLALATALKRGAPAPPSRRGAEHAVVYRHELAVRHEGLSPAARALLADLVGGRTVAEALSRVSRRRGGPGPEEVSAWIARWLGEGLFTALHRAGGGSA